MRSPITSAWMRPEGGVPTSMEKDLWLLAALLLSYKSVVGILYLTFVLIQEFTNKLGSILQPSVYSPSKFYVCRMGKKIKSVGDFILGKVMLWSFSQ